ncbi:sigma-70 family RNA polymerase sigma factor [Zooshikella marina]|uniref:sigma-70 family RNA polymerase sigma factor n=1 Tax=Zooshikella ganghwensis TaxID=202772 RepID=UPI001BAF7A54|nr:sigma-70 family RNA polymerase sigma factor [Zooshikella ganghwensis]MBU2705945.1 sigma-70 family RNA polymerase sigma factor [Zooshikella ganghwensis]
MTTKDSKNIDFFWRKYKQDTCKENFDKLIEIYTPLVNKIANIYYKKVFISGISLDDCIQYGFVGLIESIKNYNIDKGSNFDIYASLRIKGSILNSAHTFSEFSNYYHWKRKLENQHNNAMSQSIVKLDLETIINITIDLGITYFLSNDFECFIVSSESSINNTSKIDAPLAVSIYRAIESLDEILKHIIIHHYLLDESFQEIADTLSYSKARVSQLHNIAICEIRSKFLSPNKYTLV